MCFSKYLKAEIKKKLTEVLIQITFFMLIFEKLR
jgi:hypothetical protein